MKCIEIKENTLRINRITDLRLKQKTTKTWQEWFEILNAAGAELLTHRKIAEYLTEEHQLDAWWSQMVTVGYEQFYGRRERHQKPDGYEISVSKTINVPLTELYQTWIIEENRKKWLTEALTIRKSTCNKSIRSIWIDNTSHVVVNFYEKSTSKSQVVVQHSKINDKQSAEQMKVFWKNKLTQLNEYYS